MQKIRNAVSFVKRWINTLFVCPFAKHAYQTKDGAPLYFCRRCGAFNPRIVAAPTMKVKTTH